MPNGGSSRSCFRAFIQGSSSYSGPSNPHHYQTAHDDYDEDFNAVDCVPSSRCGPPRLSNRQRHWQSSAAALSHYNESFSTEVTGGTEASVDAAMEKKRGGEDQFSHRRREGKLKGVFCQGRVAQGKRLTFHPEEDDRCSRTGGTGNATFSEFDEISESHRSQVGLLVGRSSSLDQDDFDDQQMFLSSSFDGGLDHHNQEDGGIYGYHGSPELFGSPSNDMEALSRGMKISTAFKGCVPSAMKKKREKKKHLSSASFSVGSMPSIPEWPTQRNHDANSKYAMKNGENLAPIMFGNDHLEDPYQNDGEKEETGVPDIQPFSAYQKRMNPGSPPFTNGKEHKSQNAFHTTKDLPPSYHTEAQFLDTLANDLALAHNYRKLQQSIQELTGKSNLERIVQQQQNILYHMSQDPFSDVPDVVGVGKSEDQSDLVSEVGMASTSGGRYNDNASLMSALGKTQNQNRYQDDDDDDDDYGPTNTKNKGYRDAYSRGDFMQTLGERTEVEGSRYRNHRQLAPPSPTQEIINLEFYDKLNERSTRSNLGWSADRQRKEYHRQRNLGLVEDPAAYGCANPFYESYGKSLIDDSFGTEGEFSSAHYRDEPIGEPLNNESTEGTNSFGSDDDGPTFSHRENTPYFSPTLMRNNERSIDQMPSPTRVGLKSRSKKSETFDKWKEESRSASTYSDIRDSIPSRRQSLVSDNFSDTSSSFSRFSRSSKYREVLGTPYKITKDDRRSSMGSIQTHKWSNTSTVRTNKSHHSMSTHNETTSSSESSESLEQNDTYEKYIWKSPHSVAQYEMNDYV